MILGGQDRMLRTVRSQNTCNSLEKSISHTLPRIIQVTPTPNHGEHQAPPQQNQSKTRFFLGSYLLGKWSGPTERSSRKFANASVVPPPCNTEIDVCRKRRVSRCDGFMEKVESNFAVEAVEAVLALLANSIPP